MYRTIVTGYNGSDQAEDALALACALAGVSKARLVIAYAYAGRSLPVEIGSAALGVRMSDEAQVVLDGALKRVPDGVSASTQKLPNPSPAQALNDLVEREHADLLVLGSSSRGAVGRVLAGSMATRLLHGLPCAVAVAPSGFAQSEPRAIETIGVCYDGSAESELALATAISLCEATTAELRVLTVLNPPPHPYQSHPGVYVPHFDTTTGLGEDELETALSRVPAKIKARGTARMGSPAKVLAHEAEAEEVDLLVTGSRGYGPVGRVLLGGVATKLMRLAPCPVLVVPRSTSSSDPESERPVAASSLES
jgi:nucleotide-binding universal stress UspA family protein